MFFYLSKIFAFLTQPYTVICLMLGVALFLRNAAWRKRVIVAAVVMLWFFSNPFIANEVMRAWEVDPTPYQSMRRYKLGIVLTGATIPDLEPDDRVYFQRGADRVIHTVQLYKLNLLEKILISGGSGRISGESEPEADKFKRAMILMGVPEEAILIENVTRTTAESAPEVMNMLKDGNLQDSDCLLITSAFHMRRSLAVYRKAGLVPQPFSTDLYAEARNFTVGDLFMPKLGAMEKWQKLMKEWIGIAAYKVAGHA